MYINYYYNEVIMLYVFVPGSLILDGLECLDKENKTFIIIFKHSNMHVHWT